MRHRAHWLAIFSAAANRFMQHPWRCGYPEHETKMPEMVRFSCGSHRAMDAEPKRHAFERTPTGGGTVSVSYPFEFRSKPPERAT